MLRLWHWTQLGRSWNTLVPALTQGGIDESTIHSSTRQARDQPVLGGILLATNAPILG